MCFCNTLVKLQNFSFYFFQNIKKYIDWIHRIKEDLASVPILIVGNKVDLEDQRKTKNPELISERYSVTFRQYFANLPSELLLRLIYPLLRWAAA